MSVWQTDVVVGDSPTQDTGGNDMTTEFSVSFGDDFTDYIKEVTEEAVSNIDFSDHASSMFGGYDDPSDYFDMSDYVREADLPDFDDMRGDIDTLTTQVEAMRSAMVALVTALASAGITPPPATQTAEAV